MPLLNFLVLDATHVYSISVDDMRDTGWGDFIKWVEQKAKLDGFLWQADISWVGGDLFATGRDSGVFYFNGVKLNEGVQQIKDIVLPRTSDEDSAGESCSEQSPAAASSATATATTTITGADADASQGSSMLRIHFVYHRREGEREWHPMWPVTSSASDSPHPSRVERWEKINAILATNKYQAERNQGWRLLPAGLCREISWALGISHSNNWGRFCYSYERHLPAQEVDALHAQLVRLKQVISGSYQYGGTLCNTQTVAAILACVCGAIAHAGTRAAADSVDANCTEGEMAPPIKMARNVRVCGKRVHSSGCFDFVIYYGELVVCVTVATYGQFAEALVANLVGCEAMADVKRMNIVHSITTDCGTWQFTRFRDTQVDSGMLWSDLGILGHTKHSLRNVSSALYAFLLNE